VATILREFKLGAAEERTQGEKMKGDQTNGSKSDVDPDPLPQCFPVPAPLQMDRF
jgi:hypothetical protein